ncbi:hypothetical protein NBRC116589_24730 [Ruegeria sp. HU-ET01832]|uniref:hypothetical protein n=1 Tax=Ruegeria sp. HU-ET01832 TaxID=3135906 RepID=UPI00310AA021
MTVIVVQNRTSDFDILVLPVTPDCMHGGDGPPILFRVYGTPSYVFVAIHVGQKVQNGFWGVVKRRKEAHVSGLVGQIMDCLRNQMFVGNAHWAHVDADTVVQPCLEASVIVQI